MSRDSLKVIVCALDDRDSISAESEESSLGHHVQTRRTCSLSSGSRRFVCQAQDCRSVFLTTQYLMWVLDAWNACNFRVTLQHSVMVWHWSR